MPSGIYQGFNFAQNFDFVYCFKRSAKCLHTFKLRETGKLPLELHSIEKKVNNLPMQKMVIFRNPFNIKIDMPSENPGENTAMVIISIIYTLHLP